MVKHQHIGDAFFDLDAAAFLCSQLPSASSAMRDSAAPQHSGSPAATSQLPLSQNSLTQQLANSQPGESQSQTSLPNTLDLPSVVGPNSAAQGSAAQHSNVQKPAAQLPHDSIKQESGGGGGVAESHEGQGAAAACGEALPQRSRHRQRGDRGSLPEAKEGQGVRAAGSSGSLPAKPTIKGQQVRCSLSHEHSNEWSEKGR